MNVRRTPTKACLKCTKRHLCRDLRNPIPCKLKFIYAFLSEGELSDLVDSLSRYWFIPQLIAKTEHTISTHYAALYRRVYFMGKEQRTGSSRLKMWFKGHNFYVEPESLLPIYRVKKVKKK